VGGPPNPMQPIRPHSRTTVGKLGGAATCAAGLCDVIGGVQPVPVR
jgi:hypothetical protein